MLFLSSLALFWDWSPLHATALTMNAVCWALMGQAAHRDLRLLSLRNNLPSTKRGEKSYIGMQRGGY